MQPNYDSGIRNLFFTICYDDNCCFVLIYNAIYYFLSTLHNFSVSDTLIFSLEANCELLAYNYKCIDGI
jgi:hypothetical protein